MPGTVVLTRIELMFKFFIRDGIRYWIHYYTNRPLSGSLLIPIILERSYLFLIFIGMIIFTVQNIFSRNKDTVFFYVLFLTIFYFAFLSKNVKMNNSLWFNIFWCQVQIGERIWRVGHYNPVKLPVYSWQYFSYIPLK